MQPIDWILYPYVKLSKSVFFFSFSISCLTDFIIAVDGKNLLDHHTMSKELLESYGFRTPTQGPNSTSMLEIVGFLPYEMGDLILAPKDFVALMGSDFDIDKLGAYLYNTK